MGAIKIWLIWNFLVKKSTNTHKTDGLIMILKGSDLLKAYLEEKKTEKQRETKRIEGLKQLRPR